MYLGFTVMTGGHRRRYTNGTVMTGANRSSDQHHTSLDLYPPRQPHQPGLVFTGDLANQD